MIQLFQEAELPKLSQTSLYEKFNQSSGITKSVVEEIQSGKEHRVKPEDIPEIISLIRLNGDPIAKKAVEAFQNNEIVIFFNKETSNVPTALPYIVMTKGNDTRAFVFADRVVNNINSTQEYTSLMAVIEAAYLALRLTKNPNSFVMNRPLMLTLGNIYTLMAVTPLEQKIYMKGDNLVKTMLYLFAYFYRMIDGPEFTIIPAYKRIISDKIGDSVVKQIMEEVRSLEDNSFMSVLNLIKQINPVRYKDIDVLYMTHFNSTCGTSLIFALENLSYLFLLISSATYKTGVTAYGINKVVNMPAKKAVSLLSAIGNV
jgi:hypothetical protein